MADKFDVVIIGGGMVGAMLAAALGRCKLEIALIEAAEPKAFSSDQGYDLRVSAVSIASQKMFETVGAWQYMLKKRACPYRRMSVWDGDGGGETTFNSADIYEPVLGHIIENRVIQLSLLESLQAMDNVEWVCPERVSKIHTELTSVGVELASGRAIEGRLLVGADGANSAVRTLCDIEIDKAPYDQHALVATIETELPQQDITWQRFVASGPEAFLPLSGNRASMVWYNSEEEVRRLRDLSEHEFIAEMERTFPEKLGKILKLLDRGSFPLVKSHAKHYVKNRIALIGDAAHTIHPLAGQGVNLGLMDAAVLAEVLLVEKAHGKDFGRLASLRKYERARRGYNTMMIAAMDVFHHGFKQQALPLRFARSTALNIADKVSPIRNTAMRYAMGLSGDLPALAKGRFPT